MDCLLVNTTGELKFFYEPATVVFVGKSLTAIGGQNPIEPGALGKAIVFGPNMQNFADITRAFLCKKRRRAGEKPGGTGTHPRRTAGGSRRAAPLWAAPRWKLSRKTSAPSSARWR